MADIEAKIILKKRCAASELTISHNKISTRMIDPQLENQVPSIWQNLLNKYKEAGLQLWDGAVYRLDNVSELEKGSLNLQLSELKYSTIKAYREFFRNTEILEKMEATQYPYHLSTAGLIKTKDDFYLFGGRGVTSNDVNLDFIGGVISSDDGMVNEGNDLQKNMFKEMEEELNIPEQSVKKIEVLGFVLGHTSNVLMVFAIELNINLAEARELFRTRKDQEMAELVSVPAVDLESFLTTQPSYRPFVWQLLQD